LVEVLTKRYDELVHMSTNENAAPLHVADIHNVLIDHVTPAQLDLLTELGDQVKARLAEIDHQTRRAR
jgi:hypothetical protein